MKSKWLLDDYMIKTSYHGDIRLVLAKMGFEYHVEKYVPFSDLSPTLHYATADSVFIHGKKYVPFTEPSPVPYVENESVIIYGKQYVPAPEPVSTIPFAEGDCVVIYGSISFVRQQMNHHQFTPGGYLPEKSMESLGYMPFMDKPELMANYNHVFTTFKDLVDRKDFFYDTFNTNKIFIRPNSGLKTFTGLPIHSDEFASEINSLRQLKQVGDDVLILVSNCKKIAEEYRFFIVNREVITGSQYKLNDELNVKVGYSQAAYDVAVEMAKNVWQPDIAYACDVGIVNGEPKIIELNSFSSSGFYACDIPTIISAIDNVAVMEYNGDISIGGF